MLNSNYWREKGEWKLTEEDRFQICRRLNPGIYELYQLNGTGHDEDGFIITHAIINLLKIDIKDVLDCYGCSSLDELRQQYGENTLQILAECVFELESDNGEYVISKVPINSFKTASTMISILSGFRPVEA